MLTGVVANLLLNCLIIVLLSVTIAYCWLLNRRIKILQDSKSELGVLLKHFDESTKRASDSIIALQSASKKIGESIQMRIEKANFLLDDMAFMIEKGEKQANKMEAGLAVNRARNRVMAEQPVDKMERPVHVARPVDDFREKPIDQVQLLDKAISSRDKTAASLEAVLERVVSRQKTSEQEFSPGRNETVASSSQAARQRSRSEQELLELIKAGIKG